MTFTTLLWLLLNVVATLFLGFYSMQEMACVSFNKVRLQYYVAKGVKRAIWLNELLHHPARLFGTTLICVNIGLVVGSECSREFHRGLGLDPDLAPLSQVLFVVIFGELAPMFAARRYPEHVALLGIPFVYFSAKILSPFLWALGGISKLCNLLIGGKSSKGNLYLTREELQRVLEAQTDEQGANREEEEFNAVTSNIFALKTKEAKQVMTPIKNIRSIPSNTTIGDMMIYFKQEMVQYLPIYHRTVTNIVGIALPKDLIRAPNTKKVRDFARPPWFVTENASIIQILKQFRYNNETAAVILDQQGKAIGMINLDDVVEEIFGTTGFSRRDKLLKGLKRQIIIEKTFPGDMKVSDFNRQFDVVLDNREELTLSELMARELGRTPEKSDSIFLAPFELTVKEASLLEVKSILVTTRII